MPRPRHALDRHAAPAVPPLATFAALALGLMLADACKDPGRLDVFLRGSDELDLAQLDELQVVLLREDTGAELARATVAGADLADLPVLFPHSAIDPGPSYVVEVRAEDSTGVCASGKVVGRSLPASVASDTAAASVSVYVACADGVAPTGRMHAERSAHGAIWAPRQGGAVLVGGASALRYEAGQVNAAALAAVEVYDVSTGVFTSSPALLEARVLPGLGLDPEGRVVVMGGATEQLGDPMTWLDTAEEIDGAARRGKGLVDGRWLDPRVLTMTDGTFALMGTGVHLGTGDPPPVTPYQASFYDPRTEQIPGSALSRGLLNEIVVPMPGRARALLCGGDSGTPAPLRPSLLCGAGDCGCDAAPCLIDVGDDRDPESWAPGARWRDGHGAWLPCPQGGGTAYVLGGKVASPRGPDEEDSVGDVYCYRDTDEPATDFVHVGSLLRPRTSLGVVALRGGRLLVVGGTTNLAVGQAVVQQGVAEAELLSVSACACEPLEPSDITEVVVSDDLGQVGHFLYGRSAVTLGDGTVLLTGAAAATSLTSLGAAADAWVFNPDLPPLP